MSQKEESLLPTEGPKLQVRHHLEAALQCVSMEIDPLSPLARAAVESVATHVVEMRSGLAVDPTIKDALAAHPRIFKDPWFRFGVEAELARMGIAKTAEALERLEAIEPVVSSHEPSERAATYIREVTQTFVFGFDAACIALCGAAIEQLLKQTLLARGVYTERQLKLERPTAGELLKKVGLKSAGSVAAKALRDRNAIMHKSIWDPRTLRRIAFLCIRAVAGVIEELGDVDRAQEPGG